MYGNERRFLEYRVYQISARRRVPEYESMRRSRTPRRDKVELLATASPRSQLQASGGRTADEHGMDIE